MQKASNQGPLIRVSCPREHTGSSEDSPDPLPLPFALHCPLSLTRLAAGPPHLWSPPGPQVPLLGSWQRRVNRQACIQTRLGYLQKSPEPGAGALSPKLREGQAVAHVLQPVGRAWSSLASAPPHPPPPTIPLSSTVLAPARCLSTDLSRRNPCPTLPVSAHPALSPSSPHTSHLPGATGLTTLSAELLPTWRASPSPAQGRVSAEVAGKGPRLSFPITSHVSVFHPNHSPLCPYYQPMPSFKGASSLGLFPIVWARMWSLSVIGCQDLLQPDPAAEGVVIKPNPQVHTL